MEQNKIYNELAPVGECWVKHFDAKKITLDFRAIIFPVCKEEKQYVISLN